MDSAIVSVNARIENFMCRNIRPLFNFEPPVTDEEIRQAQQLLWKEMRILAESGGAAAFAALASRKYKPAHSERIGILICGGNTDAVTLEGMRDER